jgi:hypothetical protein
MAISRMNMERQLRNMGGLMTLEEPRQGFFLGDLVKKAKKVVKKVVKSPLGKAALIGGLGAYGLGALGSKSFALRNAFNLANMRAGLGTIGSVFGSQGKLSTLGDLFRVGGAEGAKFSVPRILGGLAGAGAIAAPFLMGGDEEEEDPGVPFGDPIASVEAIRDRARQYYTDPTNSALYFMPPKSAVQSRFYAAGGGLADIPREGYRLGNIVQKAGQMMKAGVGKVRSLFDDADINISVRDEDVLTDSGLQAQATGLDVSITPKSNKAVQVMDGLIEEGYDIAKAEDGSYAISSLDEGALNLIAKRLRLGGKDIDEFTANFDDMYSSSDEKMIADALRDRKAEGGLMDLGGMEKDYREGGFVPIGAEERADDVPARLSKNEFVFTADAVRNAGGGDIDKGAEVMQNMMDNLEAGGNISEESQGKENPAQEMFDQAQMLESRIV